MATTNSDRRSDGDNSDRRSDGDNSDRRSDGDNSKKPNFMERMSRGATRATGSSSAFIVALSVILVWLVTGPLFRYSDTWQLVINTGTTVVTFLMVFLIQRSQNKDSQAVHLKLNEIVASLEGASNRLVDIEDLSEDELKTLHKFYAELSELAKRDNRITASHSIDEAKSLHRRTRAKRKKQPPSEM